MRKLFIGACYGLAAGYAAIRLVQAVAEWKRPGDAQSKDALSYSRLRRSLSIADTARSCLTFVAFAYGPIGEYADAATGKLPKWAAPAAMCGAVALCAAILELPVS